MYIKSLLLLLFCFFVLQNVTSLEITEKEVQVFLGGEFNRSYNHYGDISLAGAIELQNVLKFKTGILLGKSSNFNDINLFFNTGYSPFRFSFLKPLSFSVSYMFNSIPEYESRCHSIFPFVSFNTNRAGISIGPNFRFSSFFGEKRQVESILSFNVYYNFLYSKMIIMGISIGNFNDFNAKNMGAFSLGLNTVIPINYNWSIISELELMQSGGDGFSTTFYGFAARIGAKFSW